MIHSKNLPGLITQLHRGDLSMRREETWGPVTDGIATASLAGEIVGAPANVTGTATLYPSAETGGSRVEFHVTVQVRIPLVGGKVEKMIGDQLVSLLAVEQRFTATWIANKT